MCLDNEVLLRPRFKLEINKDNETALKAFEEVKKQQKEFVVSRIDHHVFIKFPKQKQHFWSPQLHIEIDDVGEKKSLIRGLFGPNPTVWTMFMFFHFFIAGLFVGFLIWAYSNWNLKHPYHFQIVGMVAMIIFWFLFYFAGRMGKSKGNEEIKQLCSFLENTLDLKDVKEHPGCV